MRPPSLAVARLTPRFGWHRLHYSKDYLDSISLNDCLEWYGLLSLSVLVPIANQTGFHATTAVKAQRPCFAISVLSNRTDQRPGVRLEAGNSDPSACRCGGDRRHLFVRSHCVAACSSRFSRHFALRKQKTGSDRSDPNVVPGSDPNVVPFVGSHNVAACSARISCSIASRKQITGSDRSDPNEVTSDPWRPGFA